MNTTTITVNAECPGCGEPCPPNLGIPSDHQHGWEWDARTDQRWCRACHRTLRAKRHFEALGWVWKVTRHDGGVRYRAEVTDHTATDERWGRATVTIVYDPERVVLPPASAEELKERMADMVDALRETGPDIPDRYMVVHTANADALREEVGRD